MIGSYREDGKLTPRLVSVLDAAARGQTANETARALHVSPTSVERYRRVAVARLGARNTTHAVAIAVTRGLVAPIE